MDTLPENAPAGDALQLLRMAVGDQILAAPITEVREILQLARLTPVPRTPAFVRGVMNLRGAVVPVLDLAARLGRPATQTSRRSCIVVVDCAVGRATDGAMEAADGSNEGPAEGAPATPARMAMGLLVDGVFEVFEPSPGDTEAVPVLGTRVPPQFLAWMTRAHGRLVGVLSLPRLLDTPELATLIAAHPVH